MGAFDKFTWFDRRGKYDQNTDTYTPGQTGGLSALGRALSGAGNALSLPYGHGDPNYDLEQQKADIAQRQTDLEFAQHISQQRIEKGKLELEKSQVGRQNRLSDAMASLYFGAAGLDPRTGAATGQPSGVPAAAPGLPPASSGIPGMAMTLPQAAQQQNPALSGAFPLTGGGQGGLLANGLNPQTMMMMHMSPRGMSLSQAANPIANKVAEGVAQDQVDAAQKTSADLANLHQVGGVFKTLMQDYDKADSEGLAGGKFQAFKAGQAVSPLWKGLDKVIAPKGQAGAAAFTAARNELMVRLNPIWSQQVGTNKAGSNRIMESLINMAGKEVGDLSNPREAIVGAGKATMRNIAQFYKSSGEYAQRIGTDNLGKLLNSMDQKQMDQFVAAHINDTKAAFSPEEQKQFDDYSGSIFDKQQGKLKTEDIFKDLK